MERTIYGIHDNEDIIFFSLEAAEDYLIEHNHEFCMCKEWTYDFCERMIWEDVVNINEVA